MVKPKRIALFGGSFNPPHISHQMICFYLLEYKGFDYVYLIPTYKHPFGKQLISFEHRVKMCCRLALPFVGKVIIDSVEAYLSESRSEQTKQCYTIDVVREFTTRHPEVDFTLIIGSDVLEELDKWKEFNEIRKLVEVLVLARGDYVNPNTSIWLYDIAYFRKPEYSSTEIRELVAKSKSIEHCVPPRVRQYIRKNKLYI